MSQCGLCEQYTLQFPTGIRSDYYRSAGIGRCKKEHVSKVRAANSGEGCGNYEPAADMEKRIKWMEGK